MKMKTSPTPGSKSSREARLDWPEHRGGGRATEGTEQLLAALTTPHVVCSTPSATSLPTVPSGSFYLIFTHLQKHLP